MAVAKKNRIETVEQTSSPERTGLVMAILLLIFFLGTSDNQMISPLLPLIARDFGYGNEVGRVGELILPAYALAAAAAALLYGPILFSLSLLVVFFIKDFRALAIARVFTGLAAGTFSTCAIAYVADYFPYNRRGVAMSVVQAGYFGALVIGVPLANQIAKWQNWRASFAFFGALALIAFFLVALMLPEDKHLLAEQELSDRIARRFDNIRIVFEKSDRIASIAAAFFVSGGFVGFFFYLGSWLRQSLHLSMSSLNLFFIVVGFAL